MRRGSHPGTGGFTLLEVLVSLVVLALIILGLSQGLRFGVLAFQHQAATIDRRGQPRRGGQDAARARRTGRPWQSA